MPRDEAQDRRVRDMFNTISPKYDRMNRIMTLGRDRRWRRVLVGQLDLKPGSRVLDLATGTGDIAFEVLRQYPGTEVWAGDFATKMMNLGQRRPGADRLRWIACDAHALPFADDTFDAVTCGFLLRNVSDLKRAIREIRRVLKPGGQLGSLDTMPPAGWTKPVLWTAVKFGVPAVARVVTGRGDAYRYLGDSTLGFLSPRALMRTLRQAGFGETRDRVFWFRTIALVWARKPT